MLLDNLLTFLIYRVMTKVITKSDLVQLLASTNAVEITIVQRGECKMKKTNNPFFHKEGRKGKIRPCNKNIKQSSKGY